MKMKRKPAISESTPATPAIPAIPRTPVIPWIVQASIVIAVVTLVGSWYVLYFEAGFCAYFHIPYHFISLSPSIVLGTSLILLSVGLCLSIVVFISIILPTDLFRKERGDSLLSKIKWAAIRIFVLFLIVLALIIGAYVFRYNGGLHAKALEEFLVFVPQSSTNVPLPEMAVVRSYGEYLFAVPFKRDTKKFEKKLVIWKMSDMGKIPLSIEKIGPLSVIEP